MFLVPMARMMCPPDSDPAQIEQRDRNLQTDLR